jgi:3-phenylpropionate/trans-cinnamate dioxygenase ferredoxin reductase component
MADRHVDHLLIGAGLAGATCAEALREQGVEGSILLVGRELDAPYHRPPLSKGYLQGTESRDSTFFKAPEWYAEHEIELLTRCSAMKLDPQARTVKLSTREEVGFDKALLATGANVRRLNAPGAELEGIHYLRTLPNSDAIRTDAAGRRVVLIGGSYIGCEVAATLTELGSSCSILMTEPVALSRTFGERAGRFFQDRLEEHGIEVHGGDELERFEGRDGRVTHVVSRNGLELEADAVIIGAGVGPDVTLARGAGLKIAEGGGVHVSAQLESSVPGTSLSTRASSTTAGGSGSSTGTSPPSTARPSRPTCWGRTGPTTSCPTSSPTCPTGPRWSTSGRRRPGTTKRSAVRSTTASSASGTSRTAGSRRRCRWGAPATSSTRDG